MTYSVKDKLKHEYPLIPSEMHFSFGVIFLISACN